MKLPERVGGWLYDNPLFLGQFVSTLTQVVLSAALNSAQHAHTLQYHEKTTRDTEVKDEFSKLVTRADQYYNLSSYKKAVEIYLKVFNLYEKISSVARPLWQENFKQVHCNYLRSLFYLGDYQQAATHIEQLQGNNLQKNTMYHEFLKESVEFHYLASAIYLKLHLYYSSTSNPYKTELQHYAQLTFDKDKKSDIFLLLLYLPLTDKTDNNTTEKVTNQFLCYLKDSPSLKNSLVAIDILYIAAKLIESHQEKHYQALACYYYCFMQWPNEPIFLEMKQQLCKKIVDMLARNSINSNKIFPLNEPLSEVHAGFSKQAYATADDENEEDTGEKQATADAPSSEQLTIGTLKNLFSETKHKELVALRDSTQQFTAAAKKATLNHHQSIKSEPNRKTCCIL